MYPSHKSYAYRTSIYTLLEFFWLLIRLTKEVVKVIFVIFLLLVRHVFVILVVVVVVIFPKSLSTDQCPCWPPPSLSLSMHDSPNKRKKNKIIRYIFLLSWKKNFNKIETELDRKYEKEKLSLSLSLGLCFVLFCFFISHLIIYTRT